MRTFELTVREKILKKYTARVRYGEVQNMVLFSHGSVKALSNDNDKNDDVRQYVCII